MRALITNLGEEPHSLDVPNSDGSMIRRLIPIGGTEVVHDIDPYDLNVDSIARQLNFTGELSIAFAPDADDLIGLPGSGSGTFDPHEFTTADQLKHKDLVHVANQLTTVSIYEDAARLLLRYTKSFMYSGKTLTSIVLTRASDAAVFTKSLTYTGENLTAVDIVP